MDGIQTDFVVFEALYMKCQWCETYVVRAKWYYGLSELWIQTAHIY